MPTYEYACRACGKHLEVVQSFSDDALTVCEECGGELRKVFSAAGLIFKGSGWHIKDYSSGAKSSTPAKSADGASASGSGDAGGAAAKKDASASSSTSSSTSSSPTSSSSSSD